MLKARMPHIAVILRRTTGNVPCERRIGIETGGAGLSISELHTRTDDRQHGTIFM